MDYSQMSKLFSNLERRTIQNYIIAHKIERAKELSITKFDNHGQKMMDAYPHLKEMGKEKLINEGINNIYHEGHAPDYLTVDQYKLSIK